MWMDGDGWVVWRDRSPFYGDRFVRKLPDDEVPVWAVAALERRRQAETS